MPAVALKVNLADSLKSDLDVAEIDASEQIYLTPNLVLACAVLYMMASDGEIEAQESSRLQAALGGNDEVLRYGLRYVQTISIEQFFHDAPEVLSTKDKWCILTNVCDALLSDGRVEASEIDLFEQMTKAFGLTTEQFAPYFKLLKLKNDKTVLGPYAGVSGEQTPAITPHFALAVSLLYMLTADGSIGTEEIGQLEAAINEFEGLQAVALKYVRSVKLPAFLNAAASKLTEDQKLFILANVCDSMMSDGEVAVLEDRVFISLVTAFGFTETAFASYYNVLEVKNIKPFDTSTFKNKATHDRKLSIENGDGVTFENKESSETGNLNPSVGAAYAANQGIWSSPNANGAMGELINRTMQDNIQSVSDDFESQANIVKVSHNATDDLNLQKIASDSIDANLQKIAVDSADANRQKIDLASTSLNRQSIDQSLGALNLQEIPLDHFGFNRHTIEGFTALQNRQEITTAGLDPNRQQIDTDTRIKNIQEIADEIHGKLNRFEAENYRFLQLGRATRFDDSFVPIEVDAVAGINRQLVNESVERNKVTFPVAGAIVSDVVVKSEVVAPEINISGPELTATVTTQPAFDQSKKSDVFVSAAMKKAIKRGGVGFGLVKAVVASATIAFTSPIDMKVAMVRVVSGPLIITPIVLEISRQDEPLVLNSAVQLERRP
jgi:uncharacterized tellurite resistance protein B-like protein